MHSLLRKDRVQRSSDRFFMFFSTALLALSTINLIVESIFGEEWWVVNQDYPGGSAAWFAANVSVWYQTLGTAAGVALNLLADGLMVSEKSTRGKTDCFTGQRRYIVAS